MHLVYPPPPPLPLTACSFWTLMIRIRQLALWLPVLDQLMTLTYSTPNSKYLSKKSDNVTAADGNVNTTLPATSTENREINVTASSGNAEREVNDIMENRLNK